MLSVIGTNPSKIDLAYIAASVATDFYTSRTYHRSSSAVTSLRLVYTNTADTSLNANKNNPGPNAITVKVGVQRAHAGNIDDQTETIIPITFGGVANGVIAPGAIVESDTVPFVLAAGEIFFIRTFVSCALPGSIPVSGTADGTNTGNGKNSGQGIGLGIDASYSGTIYIQDYGTIYKPAVILGDTGANVVKSIAITGDSIAEGTGDGGTLAGLAGFLERAAFRQTGFAFDLASPIVPIGYVKVTRGGAQLHPFIDTVNNSTKLAICAYATNVYCQLWGNDPLTVDQIKADILTETNYFTNLGKKVFQMTHTPGATSTDHWLTIANQTEDNTAATKRGVDAWIRDTTATGFKAQCATPALVQVSDVGALTNYNAAGAIDGKGELWPAAGPVLDSGTSAASNMGISDASKAWTRNQWLGYYYIITSGTALGTVGIIQVSDTTTLVLQGSVTPAGSTYEIRKFGTLDGVHPGTIVHQTAATAFNPSDLIPSGSVATPPATDPYKSDYTNAAFVEVNFKPNPPGSFTATGLGTALRPEGDLVYIVPANMQGGRIVFERRLHSSTDPWVAIGKVDGPDANTAPPAIFQDLTVANGVTYEWRAYALPKGDFNPAVFP